MKRKTKTETVEVAIEEKVEVMISPFTSDFGREDLNSLRDKVNEIIKLINDK